MKRFMYMMDSMTDDELDGRVDLNQAPSQRRQRARGSSTHPMEVQMLLRCHKQFEGRRHEDEQVWVNEGW